MSKEGVKYIDDERERERAGRERESRKGEREGERERGKRRWEKETDCFSFSVIPSSKHRISSCQY